MGTRERDGDLERLIPLSITDSANRSNLSSPYNSPTASGAGSAGKEVLPSLPSFYSPTAFSKVIRSWASKKFMTGCVILLPLAITFYITWWFIHFVDGFFSPIYSHLGIDMFGLGFVTSITFIFLVGVFMSSWVGASLLSLGEWFIRKMPLMSYIYVASKQISAAISPDQSSQAFKEVAIVRHPRIGEYAFGFITSTIILRKSSGSEELCCVYVPTNHLYLGDIFLINSKDIMRPNLSVREGIEIVISGGMSIPKIMTIMDSQFIMSPRVVTIRDEDEATKGLEGTTLQVSTGI
ncbi:UNVERIFIED_CONTAM: protein LIKE COV 3 [Sesamum radiatum]|uniref:Protein LIKE COV 3 n=1 Tax=Sesamum radiatum TaxID=300843 RepID=A0AAW2P4T7_SESRA